MATYAIGDVQGCRRELEGLLAEISFDASRDRAWFVGDLVNRGPDSAGVLRLVRSLGAAAVCVLGNHDLHLLARWMGVRGPKRADRLAQVLRAGDRDELLEWLRHRPLVHVEGEHVLVHAGLAPEWTPRAARKIARKLEKTLRGEKAARLLKEFGARKRVPRWDAALPKWERRICELAYLTRLRCLAPTGAPDDRFAGPPEERPVRLTPWFDAPGRRSGDATVVFGHWAALGLRMEPRWMCVDSGCVWGRTLTAVRLEDRAVFQVPAADPA